VRAARKDQSFWPYIYAFDLMLPIGDFGQKEAWTPKEQAFDPWFLFPEGLEPIEKGRWLLPASRVIEAVWAVKVLGWLMGTTFLAGIAGLFRREREQI